MRGDKAAQLMGGQDQFTILKRVTQVTTNPAENGKVLQQNPAPDQPRDPAAEVRIFVGKIDTPPTSPPASPGA